MNTIDSTRTLLLAAAPSNDNAAPAPPPHACDLDCEQCQARAFPARTWPYPLTRATRRPARKGAR